jgi:Family of unknown function (DUF6600)
VYHYGNWYYLSDVGWVWIPGYQWSPAQVRWIDFDDYIGWAPLTPAGYFWGDPWDIGPVVVWNIVSIRDFHKSECDKHIIRTPIPKPRSTATVVRNAPTVTRVETLSNIKIEKLSAKNAKMKEPNQMIKQAQLPRDHIRRTQPFRDRINREVLAPRIANIKHR